jgi:singapore isolate B (sub-type 7) whole genome shotgun sequence assembly, scaffold_9
MENSASILNPNNPLIDSEEEDDDFEPGKIVGSSVMVVETPVTHNGLFVTTRSGKGGNLNDSAVLDDVDASLKRRAATVFEEMVKEDQMESERIRKKPKLQDVVIWDSSHYVEI